MTPRMQIAKDAWGVVPDWIEMLVAACDAEGASQNKVGKMIGRTPGVVSQAIRKAYAGNMVDLEDRVRSALSGAQQKCPDLGWIDASECLVWRDRADGRPTGGPMRVMMYRACRKCPVYTKEQIDAE